MVSVTSPASTRSRQETEKLKFQIILALLVLIVFMGVRRRWDVFSDGSNESLASNRISSLLHIPTNGNNDVAAKVAATTIADLPISTKLNHQSPPRPKTPAPPHDKTWPALTDIVNGKEIVSDPQFLLDFAIIGFEKSGSSTFMKWLGAHPQIQCFQEEIYDLYQGDVPAMVKRLHKDLKPGYQYKRGYKSPGDIFLANTIHLLDDYFPKTRLILSLRHPILYYQSIYNFRIQNNPPGDPFHTPLEGIGECKNTYPGYVCTNHANYGQYMYRLGKTLSKYPTPAEQLIINEKPKSAAKARITRNLIFVVEMSQLKDSDPARKALLKQDLQEFLGLDSPLQDNPVVVPGKKWSPEIQAQKDAQKMKICEDQYVPLREELMRVSKITATWILESFVKSDDVFTTSPEFFEESIRKWMVDPCATSEAKEAKH